MESIETLKEYGKSLDWSHGRNLIASAKRGRDGYYDVFVMKPDGSGERCLTCDSPGAPRKHNGNPAWHPSGKYIVFTAEKQNIPEKYREWAIKIAWMSSTGIDTAWGDISGHNWQKYIKTDLWIMDVDGSNNWPQFALVLRFRQVTRCKACVWPRSVAPGSSESQTSFQDSANVDRYQEDSSVFVKEHIQRLQKLERFHHRRRKTQGAAAGQGDHPRAKRR